MNRVLASAGCPFVGFAIPLADSPLHESGRRNGTAGHPFHIRHVVEWWRALSTVWRAPSSPSQPPRALIVRSDGGAADTMTPPSAQRGPAPPAATPVPRLAACTHRTPPTALGSP